jgi:hypothetical protein
MTMSVAESLLLQDLKRRVEALERAQAANRKPLAERAAANHAAGESLYAEVREILQQHQGPKRLTAKQVLPKLTRDPKPSIRQVQDLLKRARAESAASRS